MSVCFNIFLIPLYGAVGCAIAALITQALVSFLLVLISAKKLQIYFTLKSIWAFIGFTCVLFAIKMTINLGSSMLQTFVADVLLVGVFAFLFSIIDLKSLRKIFNLKDEPQ